MRLEDFGEVLMESERFALRPFAEADLKSLYEIESDSVLKQYVGGPVKETEAEWIAKARRNILGRNIQFALVDSRTGLLAGRVSLGPWCAERELEVQLILAKQFVGRQLGEEACSLACQYAFTSLSAASVWAVVDAAHRASLELVSRLNFIEEPIESDQIGKRYFVLRNAA